MARKMLMGRIYQPIVEDISDDESDILQKKSVIVKKEVFDYLEPTSDFFVEVKTEPYDEDSLNHKEENVKRHNLDIKVEKPLWTPWSSEFLEKPLALEDLKQVNSFNQEPYSPLDYSLRTSEPNPQRSASPESDIFSSSPRSLNPTRFESPVEEDDEDFIDVEHVDEDIVEKIVKDKTEEKLTINVDQKASEKKPASLTIVNVKQEFQENDCETSSLVEDLKIDLKLEPDDIYSKVFTELKSDDNIAEKEMLLANWSDEDITNEEPNVSIKKSFQELSLGNWKTGKGNRSMTIEYDTEEKIQFHIKGKSDTGRKRKAETFWPETEKPGDKNDNEEVEKPAESKFPKIEKDIEDKEEESKTKRTVGQNIPSFKLERVFQKNGDVGESVKRNFRCTQCGRSFRHQSKLNSHMMDIHFESSVVSRKKRAPTERGCSECGKLHETKTDLYLHRLSHHEQYCFSCSQCANPFTDFASLKGHMEKEHGRKEQWPCPACGNSYSQAQNLHTHMEKVHFNNVCKTGTTVPCKICGKHFSERMLLKSHLKTVHPFSIIFNPLP